jgi:predicted nucleotidyltransferase
MESEKRVCRRIIAMAMTLEDVRARRDEIRRLVEANGARNPRIFGSVVRGTSDERSDVDILIDFAAPEPEGFAYFGALDRLQQDLSRVLGMPVHVTLLDPSSTAGRRILREAVPL